MTSTFDKIISLGPNFIFVGRTTTLGGTVINSVGKWDGVAGNMQMVDNGVNNPTWGGLALLVGQGTDDVYVAGAFTQVGGSLSANRIAYYNGTSWSNLNGATVFDNNVTCLALDYTHNLLYAGSHQSSATQNRVSVWNGTVWTGIAEDTVNNYCKMACDNDGNLYLGYGFTFKKYMYSTSSWETISTYLGGSINDVKFNSQENRVYVILNMSTGSSVKYYDIENESINSLTDLGSSPRAIAFNSSNEIFVACQSPSTYEGSIVKHTGSSWLNIYNYQNTSGVLDIEIDANDNIFCWANAGSLTIGVLPYANGDWEAFSNSKEINYGGSNLNSDNLNSEPSEPSEQETNILTLKVGDDIIMKGVPTQRGKICKKKILNVQKSIAVKWKDGPMYKEGEYMGYFGNNVFSLDPM